MALREGAIGGESAGRIKRKDRQQRMSDDRGNAHAPQAGDQADDARGPEAAAKTEPQPRAPGQEEQALAALKEQNSQLQDQLLRKVAEFENFRKRMFRERDEGIRYANASLLEDLLPIIDDFERAIASADTSRDYAALHKGVSLIERQMVSVLERNWGLKRCTAVGEPFDPERHEAVAVQDSDQYAEAVVLEELQKGYTLHDRVLRPAKVKVSRPLAPGGASGKNSTSEK